MDAKHKLVLVYVNLIGIPFICSAPKPQQTKNIAGEIIRNSKQYRMLIDMGFKKDDVEITLRATNMNLEEAIDILQSQSRTNNMDGWRRHDDIR